jgi:3-hydroxy-9,10-secoandrosta-1,3,5(10)-triene-9,17-dione monooxygenase reductase component
MTAQKWRPMTAELNLERPDPATMRTKLGHFCTGVAAITGHDGNRPLGFAWQSVTSVTLRPPYVSFCPASTSSSWPLIRDVGSTAINVLSADQQNICLRFAISGADKFGDVGWSPGRNGAQVLDGVLATIEADVEFEHTAGDHSIVAAHVTTLRAYEGRQPLLFYRGSYGELA